MAAVLTAKRTSLSDSSGLNEAARNAENLFETSTIAEIREVSHFGASKDQGIL